MLFRSKLPAPTASPTTARPAIMAGTEKEAACKSAPKVKAESARMMTFLRPRLSARTPETGEIRRAKRAVAEVMRDLSRVVKGWPKELLIETRVDEMTPVSSEVPCQ